MAGTYHLVMEQGADLTLTVVKKDSSGNVVDISGASAAMQMRPDKRSATKLFDATSGGGEITIDGPNGQVSVVIPGATTAGIHQPGVYDLKLTLSDGTIERLLEGRIELSPAVTR